VWNAAPAQDCIAVLIGPISAPVAAGASTDDRIMPRDAVSTLLSSALKLGVGAVMGIFVVYKLTGSFDAELRAARAEVNALSHRLEEHNVAMEREAAARRADNLVLRALLRGICYGTSSDIPQARGLCDIQDVSR
jgi:hypothetical protein